MSREALSKCQAMCVASRELGWGGILQDRKASQVGPVGPRQARRPPSAPVRPWSRAARATEKTNTQKTNTQKTKAKQNPERF